MWGAQYVPIGYLVFSGADNRLYAAPLDPDRLETTGPALRLLEGISTGGTSRVEFSADGTLIYQQIDGELVVVLNWFEELRQRMGN